MPFSRGDLNKHLGTRSFPGRFRPLSEFSLRSFKARANPLTCRSSCRSPFAKVDDPLPLIGPLPLLPSWLWSLFSVTGGFVMLRNVIQRPFTPIYWRVVFWDIDLAACVILPPLPL